MIIRLALLLLLFSINAYGLDGNLNSKPYQIQTTKRSIYELDKDGKFVVVTDQDDIGHLVLSENEYIFTRSIDPQHTALIVMDPWQSNGFPLQVFKTKILPLIHKCNELGIKVIVFTNRMGEFKLIEHSKIYPELNELANNNLITVLYHQDLGTNKFAEYLKNNSIDTLIYSGFASNACVIGRPTGIICMHNQNFRLFFVPEASAAIEFKNTIKKRKLHEATVMSISLTKAELIAFNDFMHIND